MEDEVARGVANGKEREEHTPEDCSLCWLECAKAVEIGREMSWEPGGHRGDDWNGVHGGRDKSGDVCDLRVFGKCVCGVWVVVGVATTEEVEWCDVCEDCGEKADEDGLYGEEVEDAQEIGVRDVCEECKA